VKTPHMVGQRTTINAAKPHGGQHGGIFRRPNIRTVPVNYIKKGAATLAAPVSYFCVCLKACSPEPPLHQGVMQ